MMDVAPAILAGVDSALVIIAVFAAFVLSRMRAYRLAFVTVSQHRFGPSGVVVIQRPGRDNNRPQP
jgi:hypothetical protein